MDGVEPRHHPRASRRGMQCGHPTAHQDLESIEPELEVQRQFGPRPPRPSVRLQTTEDIEEQQTSIQLGSAVVHTANLHTENAL